MSQVPSQAIKAESQPSKQEDDPAYVNLKVKQQVFLPRYELLCKTSAPNTIKDGAVVHFRIKRITVLKKASSPAQHRTFFTPPAAHGFMGSAHVG